MAEVVVPGLLARPVSPPATRTLPVPRRVAVLADRHSLTCEQVAWAPRPLVAADHWPVAGWYSSLNTPFAGTTPAGTSTSPSGRRVPSRVARGVVMLPVRVNVPVTGL